MGASICVGACACEAYYYLEGFLVLLARRFNVGLLFCYFVFVRGFRFFLEFRALTENFCVLGLAESFLMSYILSEIFGILWLSGCG